MVAAFACGMFVTEQAHAQKLLRWKYRAGETLQYELVQGMKQKLYPGGDAPPMDFTTTQVMDFSEKIESVDPQGPASMTQTVTRSRFKLQSPQGIVIDYDTASGKKPEGMATMLQPMFEAVINKPIQMKITERGEVKDMKLPAGMLESINKVAGSGPTGNVFSEDFLRQLSEICVFPQEPVSPGSTWKHTVTTKDSALGQMVVTNLMRYEGTENRNGLPVEKITFSTQFQKPQQQKPGTVGIKEQTGGGTIYFDAAAGQIQESINQMTMKMDITVMGRMMNQDLEMNLVLKPKASQP
jgi:hypothetical protein